MDQLDEQSFLDELMSLRREEAPVPAPAPWQAYPASGMMTTTDLLFYGGEGAAEASSGMDLAGPFQQPMAPPPAAPPHRPHEEFNFDCLSEVCNPYRSCTGGGVPGPGVVHAAGQAYALHDAMAEDHPSCGNLHRGGGSSSSPVPFVFGEGGAGETSEEMTRGVFSGGNPRSKLNRGTTSKNLMAERRRRKRLNDRLSMLRSIVPKISKMDRTSILEDTLDYVNELTERIKTLEEEIGATPEELNLLNTTKNFSSGSSEEMPMRNSTKFIIEKQGDVETRIDICCATSPGVLISTVSALEVLGLEIEQCVVSCFGDFAMQASCSQEEGRSRVTSTDEIKHALFTSAGYGGRCL
ncbi:hypothetical protein CFC21_059262 [Triticum aestivum]|uniref:BHLH domain-containing protein n=2 Tax=Triticum aestivum TaxID=4565 RepID=A0A9R1GQ15_WHEAT|nr:transcription factor bHLH61-like [Triticum dicoccoides]XP_044371595.1 transcription factor BHLH3-like [Triticum aestivum]KAF7050974.1 hypothetical protein CFC21_059262 [Triticum aestivum]